MSPHSPGGRVQDPDDLTPEGLQDAELAAEERDAEGVRRDREAEARDLAAGIIDQAAEDRAATDFRTAAKDLARAAAGRAAAAQNRSQAMRDREVGAEDRAHADADRAVAAVERARASEAHARSGASAAARGRHRKAGAAAAARDEAAAKRDQRAKSRDLAAGNLDHAAEVRAVADGASASDELARAAVGRVAAAGIRAQAVDDREVAADDRARAESDRRVAAQDRAQGSSALLYQALHDGVTGLPNRAMLLDVMDRELMAATRDKRACGLLVMDIDDFKHVNDRLGHDAGDQLLVDCAARIKRTLDPQDTLARLSGDEFAILPFDARDVETVIATAARVTASLDEPFMVAGISVRASVSIGIALFPDHALDASTLMRRADVAMYVAKQSHSGYAVYSVGQEENLGRRMTLLGELREAIASNEIVLYYQPQIDMRDGHTVGMEALVRWTHPRFGLVPPSEFIPAAEASDLIGPLTRWILNEALRQLQTWEAQGVRLNASVNISAANLLDPGLPTLVGDLLHVWTIPAQRLTLEITETTVISTDVDDTLRQLRALGIGLSIDDFGTGYASLTYLRRLPVTELKLDRSFVGTMATNADDATIVKPAISLGHNLGLRVVAEGVEDEPTWAMLAAFDCDLAQGYYMARPMPSSEVLAWLAESPWGIADAPTPLGSAGGHG
ncbi:MAG: hypothetical protein QOK05_170 [Chloroflexota bacterium]|jgi:diguanylate cyclase (GGDEF)-like protein|nr:hypothetical protein [Chloroflexota bacterium]